MPFPDVLRRKITSDNSIFDRCDSIIRNFETIASSTGEVYGDKKGKRANMAKRIGLQLHWLVDQERERAANSPEVPAAPDQKTVNQVSEPAETLDQIKDELAGLVGLEAVKKERLVPLESTAHSPAPPAK
jgi:hypothetical protein